MLYFWLRRWWTASSFIATGLLLGATSAADDDSIPASRSAIVTFDDVHVGMKGYGLSVFRGAAIEPFSVEVVSVMRDYFMGLGSGGAQQGLIWIQCTDERMRHLGPVYGMSGSPIYLWDVGEEGTPGTGGRLAGAFAMGFPYSETCYVGVQPIEQMRRIAERAVTTPDTAMAPRGAGHNMVTVLRQLADRGRAEGMRRAELWPLEVLANWLVEGCGACDPPPPSPPTNRPASPLPSVAGEPQLMLLPVPVMSPSLRRVMAPMMRRSGLVPVGAGGRAGRPPKSIDAAAIRFEPGAVLSIPMVWGDMDYSASGTCTEVWPDGRVLAFGHSLFGEGNTSLPIATGFVHMVMPLSTFSFKVVGSALLQPGALVRDENSAVVTSPSGRYRTGSMSVRVKVGDVPKRSFSYTMVHHRTITPMLTAITAFESTIVDRQFPLENTMRLRADLKFEGDRTLTINSRIANTGPLAVAYALLGPLSIMANNPFATVMIEDAEIDIDIEPVSHAASLLHVRVDRLEYAPGETIGMTATYQPYRKDPVKLRLSFELPQQLPDGSYGIAVSSAAVYAEHMLRRRPHLGHVESVDDILELLREVHAVDPQVLYLSMELPRQGLAIRRTELPDLPSSRHAILLRGATASTVPFADWVEKRISLDVLLQGEAVVRVNVRKDLVITP